MVGGGNRTEAVFSREFAGELPLISCEKQGKTVIHGGPEVNFRQ